MLQTIDQFRANLADPDYAVGFILQNNPEDVADNLRGMGLTVSNTQDITNALNGFLEDGRGELFVQALSVPVKTELISDEQLVVLAQQATAMANAAGQPLAKSAQGGFNVNALLGGLATGALFYLNSNNQNQVQPTNTPKPVEQKDNTMMWVLIGGAVIVVIVVLAMVLKKK